MDKTPSRKGYSNKFQGKTLLRKNSANAVQVEKEDFDDESMTQDNDKTPSRRDYSSVVSAVEVEKDMDSIHDRGHDDFDEDFDNESMDTQDHDKGDCEVFQLRSEYRESTVKQLQLNSAFHLEDVFFVEEQRFKELAFVKGYSGPEKSPVFVITQRKLFYHPPFGYTSRVTITVKENKYVINVLAFHLESGELANSEDAHELCNKFSCLSSFKFCPGIEWNLYEQQYFQVIRYHLKSVRYSISPFQRVDSIRCALWFKLPVNASLAEKSSDEVMCSACKRLRTDLNWQLKRTQAESPSRKVKRQAASSKAKLSYMSPASQLKRKQNMISERNNDKIKLRRYENTEVTLADDQHDDMCNVVKTIEEVGKNDLDKVFAEGDSHGVGDKIREVWLTDKRQQSKQFHTDQAKNGKCIYNLY